VWIATLSVALASTADAVKAPAAQPLESLAVTASSLGQKTLDDPACFALEPIPKVVESDESFVIRYAAPESSTGGCRDVET
jgi:hypothetical protein